MKDAQCSEISLEFNRHIINLLDSLSALSELAALSIHDFDEAQLLKRALEALMANQDMERCSIFLVDDNDELKNAAGLDWPEMLQEIGCDEGEAAPPHRKGTRYRLGEGIMGQAAATTRIQHCHSCADDPQFSTYGQDGVSIRGSLICVPIQCETRVLGVLNVFYPEPEFFNTWHERLLLLFCQILGRLLLNHRYTFHLNSLLDERTRETLAANSALREKHRFLQSVMDSVPDPVMVIGTDYRLLMANLAARRYMPPPVQDEVLTCHLVSHGSPVPCDGANHQCPLRIVQETDGTASTIHVHRGSRGEFRQVELRASPLHDAGGQLIGIVESARDITERVQMEMALRSAKEYAENLIRTANVLVVELDNDGNLKVFNPAAEAVTGYSVAELAGRNWFEVLVPRDRYPQVWEEFERLTAGGLPGRFENPIRTKSGEERYIAWQNSVLQEDGTITGIVSFGMDITERRKADERLREMERRMRALLDAGTESNFLLDPTGRILALNTIAAQRFGKLPADMLHTNFFDRLPPELARSRRSVFDQVIAQCGPLLVHDRRGLTEFETQLLPVLDDAGIVESVAIYARDVTEQRRTAAIDAMFHRLDLMLLKWRMDMKSIAQMFCDEMVRLFDLAAVWVGRAERDGTLNFVAAGEPEGSRLLEILRRHCQRWQDDNGDEAGICQPAGDALRSGTPQKVGSEDGRCAGCRDDARPADIPAALLLPLALRGGNWGVLALYARDARLFEQVDVSSRLTAIASRLCVSLEASLQQEWLTLLDAAVANAGNAVFITDATGHITWANPSFNRLSGYALEEIVGKTPAFFKSGKHDDVFYRSLWETIQTGEAWRGEMINARRDGTHYCVNQTITPLKDANDCISHYVSVLEDITDRKAKEAHIEHLANFDTLTNLPNRSLLLDRLGQAINFARRENRSGALLFLDLDGFKAVNDRLGHEAGDRLLKAAAERLRQQTRESDTVARLGGDEFVLVLPSITAIDDAVQVAEKTAAALAQPFELDETLVTIGASIGIALYPAHGESVEKIIGAADHAMYEAKRAGRGTVRVFCGGLPAMQQ